MRSMFPEKPFKLSSPTAELFPDPMGIRRAEGLEVIWKSTRLNVTRRDRETTPSDAVIITL